MNSFTQENSLRRTVNVRPAARELGISPNSLYSAIARGEIKVIRIGRRITIARAVLDRMLGKPEAALEPQQIQHR